MRVPELLAPAGNMDALRAALHFGADAVYGGIELIAGKARHKKTPEDLTEMTGEATITLDQ